MIDLIGGILVDSTLRRDVTLRALHGTAEMALAKLGGADLPQPEKVTGFLVETVAEVGGQPLDRPLAGGLSVGDRQHLVRRIGAAMGLDLVWLTSACTACGVRFDIAVRQAGLPVKPAAPGYPSIAVEVAGRKVQVRSPTGEDQAAVQALDDTLARDVLLRRLVDWPDDRELAPEVAEDLEAAIEEISPEVSLQASATCPECGAANLVDVDPYLTLDHGGDEIYDDVHLLAARYHWSEHEILSLPRSRRKKYLSLIDRDRGMFSRVPTDHTM